MKYLVIIALVFTSQLVLSDPACEGEVKHVMDWPEKCPNNNLAYFFSIDDSNNEKWVCTLSDKSASIVLAALASGKKVKTVFSGRSETCEELSVDYLTPQYLYISK